MLIINGIVHTMDGQTIPRGFVAVSGGKIAREGGVTTVLHTILKF